jgi:hypothetical protein
MIEPVCKLGKSVVCRVAEMEFVVQPAAVQR